jgi:hypothetical protein
MSALREAFDNGFFYPGRGDLGHSLRSVLKKHSLLNDICHFSRTIENLNKLGINLPKNAFRDAHYTGFNKNDNTRRLKALIEQALSEDKKEINLDDFT